MNNKNLLFGFSAAIVIGIAFIFASFVNVQKYIPLQNTFNQTITPTSHSVSDYTGTALDNSKFIGPTNLGGRIKALLIDRNNANLIFAGSCGGGLWKTSTGGTSWNVVDGINQNLIVTSIVQSPNGDIYVGTGDGIASPVADMIGYKGFIGKGIFKSSDGGNTFAQISSTNPTNANDPNSEWAFVNNLTYDNTSNKLYAATNLGVRVSNDGGNSWNNPISSTEITYQISCSGNTVVVAYKTKCYVSTDGGNNFTDQSTGAPDKLPSTGVNGISVSVAPSNSNYIYASVAKSDGQLYNIYRSVDGGNTWSVIGPGSTQTFSPLSNHGWYHNLITVFPNNENKIIVGGANLWMWDNGGNWIQKSVSNINSQSIYYVPDAQHQIVFHPQNNNIFYIASDGGVSKTIDGGETYRWMYINMATTSFYSATIGFGDFIFGGTQGYGTVALTNGLPSPQNVYGTTILDSKSGGNVAASFIVNNKSTVFASTLDGSVRRSPDYNFIWVDFLTSRMGTPKCHSLIPLCYWESLTDYETTDSVLFINNSWKMLLKNGDGATTAYHDTIIPNMSSALIAPGSVVITTKSSAGIEKVVDDGLGKLRNQTITGEELGTIIYQNADNQGEVIFNFKNAPSYGAIVELKYSVRYNANSPITVKSYIDDFPFTYTLPFNLEPYDSIYVKDIVQSKLFLGAANNVWMTRKGLDFQKPPHWFLISGFSDLSDTIKCISNTHDGNTIFYGTRKGKLHRATNIIHATDSITGDTTSLTSVIVRSDLTSIFNQTNRLISSIATDPTDANHIVITLGGYNFTNYIYECRNALDANPTFQLKQGNLPSMPIYSAIIEMSHPNLVIIGTENGVYYTEDISASSPVWVEHTSVPRIPVYSLKQQTCSFFTSSYLIYGDTVGTVRKDTLVKTTGKIIIGTFGRGLYENNTFKLPNEVIDVPLTAQKLLAKVASSEIGIFPNPAINNTVLNFNISEKSNVDIVIYDVQGRVVNNTKLTDIIGEQNIKIDCSKFVNGTYYVQINTENKKLNGKFVILK